MHAAGEQASSRVERRFLIGLVILMTLLSALPLLRLLIEGLSEAGRLSLGPLRRALSDPLTWVATRNSLETAFGGTLIAVALRSRPCSHNHHEVPVQCTCTRSTTPHLSVDMGLYARAPEIAAMPLACGNGLESKIL